MPLFRLTEQQFAMDHGQGTKFYVQDVLNGILQKHKGSVRLLFQSLGVKYHDDRLLFSGSNRHAVPVPLGHLPSPIAMDDYVSIGFVRQNHLVLEMLAAQNSDNSPKLTTSAFFLPMLFPKLYGTMNPVYKQQYESAALGSFLKYGERMHAPHEKSPEDYIAFFNAKGFYFEKAKNGFEVRPTYTDSGTSCPLPKRTGLYLNSAIDLSSMNVVINRYSNIQKNRLLLRSVYAISSLIWR